MHNFQCRCRCHECATHCCRLSCCAGGSTVVATVNRMLPSMRGRPFWLDSARAPIPLHRHAEWWAESPRRVRPVGLLVDMCVQRLVFTHLPNPGEWMRWRPRRATGSPDLHACPPLTRYNYQSTPLRHKPAAPLGPTSMRATH